MIMLMIRDKDNEDIEDDYTVEEEDNFADTLQN